MYVEVLLFVVTNELLFGKDMRWPSAPGGASTRRVIVSFFRFFHFITTFVESTFLPCNGWPACCGWVYEST